ncbi:MAG TPA: phosphoribosylamine--glycine ligase [Candidatus Eisenbacteria bacterium]|jgi:phosphoribosylamine--glycine ligase|nr:phosphoribosylamine--glycine ligase [Candidatus Eisenbacteria bacterium]
MRILVIGGGGREHALVWRLTQSPRVTKIWCAPGNGGIAAQAECVAIDAGDVAGLAAFAESMRPDLTVVGPELPLVNGISDAFGDRGWPIVAPSKLASQLEGSKVFTKEFLQRHQIPTPRMYGAFDSSAAANAALRHVEWPLVIKADGLCAGKGVCLAPDAPSASDFIDRVLDKRELGAGGARLLLEQALVGEELSFIILTDGNRYAPMVPSRDHKRAFDGDRGPNTGGMGAYSSDELLPSALRDTILRTVVEPTMRGLASDGIRYQGFLYFGLMLTKAGPEVLEFNCRLGDPEAQAIVSRMDFDLAEVLTDAAAGRLDPSKLKWKPGASVCVVLASGGYPGKFTVGQSINGLTDITPETGVKVFHAGTRLGSSSVVSNGGRVLGVTAARPSVQEAVSAVYSAISKIGFDGMQYRRDIAGHASRVGAAGD